MGGLSMGSGGGIGANPLKPPLPQGAPAAGAPPPTGFNQFNSNAAPPPTNNNNAAYGATNIFKHNKVRRDFENKS